jgi:hypothetical protein
MPIVNQDQNILRTSLIPSCLNLLNSIKVKAFEFVNTIFQKKALNSYDRLSSEYEKKVFTFTGAENGAITDRLSRLNEKLEKLKNTENILAESQKADEFTIKMLVASVIATKRNIQLLETEINNLINKNTIDETHKVVQQVLFPAGIIKGMEQVKFFDANELSAAEKAYLAKLPPLAPVAKTKLDFQLNEVLSTEWVLSESLRKSIKLIDVLIEKTAFDITPEDKKDLLAIRDHYKQAQKLSAKFYRQLKNVINNEPATSKTQKPSCLSNVMGMARRYLGYTQTPIASISALYQSGGFEDYADALKACTIDHQSNKLQKAENLYNRVKDNPKLETNGLSFASLSVAPVQRMVRHELLLRDILGGLQGREAVNVKLAQEHVQQINKATNSELAENKAVKAI